MLDYILAQTRKFERDHGVAPNVVYINPVHFQALFSACPELFQPDRQVRLGFKLVILPSCQLAHPRASLLMHADPAQPPVAAAMSGDTGAAQKIPSVA